MVLLLENSRDGVDCHPIGVVEEADEPQHSHDPPLVRGPGTIRRQWRRDRLKTHEATSRWAMGGQDCPMSKVRSPRSRTPGGLVLLCFLWCHGKRSFPKLRDQAELGHEKRARGWRKTSQTSSPMPKSSASSSIVAGASGLAWASPLTTSGTAMAASIALSVLSGSMARQQSVIESASARK